MEYHVIDIIKGTTVDGPGLRTSIYFAGCNHHCEGCHNPQSWDSHTGAIMTLQEIMDIIEEEDFNVTFSGGDPLFNPEAIEALAREIKNNRRNLWIYTGYLWEEIVNSPELLSVVRYADVVVDGRFVKELKDIDLRFRGSSNQRLIDVAKSLQANQIIEWTTCQTNNQVIERP